MTCEIPFAALVIESDLTEKLYPISVDGNLFRLLTTGARIEMHEPTLAVAADLASASVCLRWRLRACVGVPPPARPTKLLLHKELPLKSVMKVQPKGVYINGGEYNTGKARTEGKAMRGHHLASVDTLCCSGG